MTYHIITYGCQMNHSDSKKITELLEKRGIAFNSNKKRADLIIVNACSVRQSATDRVYGQINELKNSSTNKKQKIILTGCLLEKDKEKLKGKNHLFFNIKNIKKLPTLLKKIMGRSPSLSPRLSFARLDSSRLVKMSHLKKNNPTLTLPLKRGGNKNDGKIQETASIFIPISNGCNNYCSYCVVPYVRGNETHRPAQEIIYEAKRAIEQGYKEIWLLGQNVNSYQSRAKGRNRMCHPEFISGSKNKQILKPFDLAQGGQVQNDSVINFPKLLKKINDLPGDFWIKFISSHPKDMSDELINTIAKCDKICKYIHLPIQSGDNTILEKMNRRYTIGHYKNLVKKIRAKIPDTAISTDIIVGFPGETKKQFANTAKLMREIKFDMAYLSQYSPRANTKAFALSDNITKQEKKQREEILNNILKKTALQNNKKYIGKTVKVLIEKIDNNIATGKTATHKTVKIKINKKETDKINENDFINAEITDAGSWGLSGEMISN